MDTSELKGIIFKSTIEGIMKIYGFTRENAENIVNNSGLEWSIEVASDIIAHCSQEQLVDMVMD